MFYIELERWKAGYKNPLIPMSSNTPIKSFLFLNLSKQFVKALSCIFMKITRPKCSVNGTEILVFQ
jgi:hypothetical protein